MTYSEIVKVYEAGPIPVSDDRAQDFTYKVEVIRDVGVAEAYRLFLWSKDRYFVRRHLKNSDMPDNRQWENPYKVEVRRDVEGAEEYLFSWDRDKFIKEIREHPDDWQETLIEAKDNSVIWEEMKGSTVEEVLNLLTRELVAEFSSLGGDMRNLNYKELVKTIDLEPIIVEETNQDYHFRIEIMRDERSEKRFPARVYRRESYSLQPTFKIDGELAYDVANCWLWVEDEQNLLGKIEGSSVEEVVEQSVKARDELEARLRG
jgi:hypothetical protein